MTNDTPPPAVQTVYVTGPRNGTATAALTLGILSVCLIFIPVVSSIMGLIAVILGGNAKGQVKVGTSNAGTAATWGLWLGATNLIVWGVLYLLWQLGSN